MSEYHLPDPETPTVGRFSFLRAEPTSFPIACGRSAISPSAVYRVDGCVKAATREASSDDRKTAETVRSQVVIGVVRLIETTLLEQKLKLFLLNS